LGPT